MPKEGLKSSVLGGLRMTLMTPMSWFSGAAKQAKGSVAKPRLYAWLIVRLVNCTPG
jgi:hypothetical protein